MSLTMCFSPDVKEFLNLVNLRGLSNSDEDNDSVAEVSSIIFFFKRTHTHSTGLYKGTRCVVNV